MKTALAVMVIISLSLGLAAQTARQPATARPAQPAAQSSDPALNAILSDLQRVSQATNADIGKLRIEKWKADSSQKQQMQQVADSLQKNITQAMPGLISEVQATPASVLQAFKLYHNVTVLYEFLDSLAQAAGEYGKKEEYEPLNNDASSLDRVRQKLSDYIDQSAANLEAQLKKATAPPKTTAPQTTQQGPKKIVIDDNTPTTTKKKKKKTSSTPPPQSQ
jgi:hypothetical protein